MNAAALMKPSARGLKRVCVSCGIRFYDLNKRPINCPNCQTEFSGEIKLKGRRGRVAAEIVPDKASVVANEDEAQVDQEAVAEADADTVSLDDVADMENEDNDDLEAEELTDLDELEDVDALDDDEDDDGDIPAVEEEV